ncbi:MAG: RidA family protein [Gemmatimonadota bacterium]
MSGLGRVETNDAPAAIGPYSQGIIAGDFLYTAGQIPLDPGTMEMVGADISEQTERALRNLAGVLAAGGSSMDRVVKTTVFLADMGDFAAMNEVYARHFGVHRPARSALEAAALPKGALVEIEAVARRG